MLFSVPGVENLSQTTVTIVALVLALVLVAFFGLILRRLTSGRLSLKGDRGRARQPRLGIVDVYDLDRQRQLILLRRDNVEHLLLVGGPNDVVVETNIVRAGGSRLPVTPIDTQDRADPAPERGVEIAPVRPVLEPIGMRPPEPVTARLGTLDTSSRGAIEPALKPSSVGAAPSRLSGERGAKPNGSATPSGEPTAESPRALSGGGLPSGALPGGGQPVQRPASPTETGRPDMAKQLEEALARPASEPRVVPARTLELPRATPVAQPGRSMLPFRKSEPTPTPPPQGRTESAPPSIPAAEPSPPPVEIETKRAETEVRREHAQDETERPEPDRKEPDDIEVLGAQEIPQENVRPEPVRETISEVVIVEPPEPMLDPTPPPPSAETPARAFQRPAQVVPPAAPLMVPPASQPSPAASPGRNDPFSIEDIEAEFARLLGRPVEKRDDRT